jgi:hypothetical protein
MTNRRTTGSAYSILEYRSDAKWTCHNTMCLGDDPSKLWKRKMEEWESLPSTGGLESSKSHRQVISSVP